MIQAYQNAILQALTNALGLVLRLALPISILAGLLCIAVGAGLWNRRRATEQGTNSDSWTPETVGKSFAARAGAVVLTGLVLTSCWAAVRQTLPLARQTASWRESAEATANPIPDAPSVQQYGPATAVMVEHTYSRNLTLPPDFLTRIGEQGVGVISPYLSDPSAEGVTKLTDTFRKSGRDVILTREVTRTDEEAVPFRSAQARVQFKRLTGRAYDAQFEGRYAFQNPKTEAAEMRFTFPLPQAGTLRNLSVTVGNQAVADPNDSGTYEWKGTVGAGETREVIVRYEVVGAQTWRYDMGSQRRRVQKFGLEVIAPASGIRFLRGSLTPTQSTSGSFRWELDNVVTAQQIALSFSPSTAGELLYWQALSALPASLAVFFVGACILLIARSGVQTARPGVGPFGLALGLVIFTLGLGAVSVLANYVGFTASLLLAPLAGAALCAVFLGRRFLLAAVPAALVPAAFLSGQHSGALLLLLAIVTLGAYLLVLRSASRPSAV